MKENNDNINNISGIEEEEEYIIDAVKAQMSDNNKKNADEILDQNTYFYSKYGKKSLEELERHAKINAGFHDYEEDSFADKQMIGNLCDLYKVFFEGDPQFSAFLKDMKEYAELDPYTHANYTKERLFVTSIPAKLEALNELIDAQEEALQQEIRDEEENYEKLSDKKKQGFDQKILFKQEVLDNRRRALASFDMYFYNMSKGELKDLDELSNTDIIDKTNKSPGRGYAEFVNDKGEKCYYINSSGVNLDLSIKGEGLTPIQKSLASLANVTTSDKDIKDAKDVPIFPHEPRMTDVSQRVSGECYLYAGLQNIARLYPQKIKEMIKDNGDGTATVRLWGKYKEPGSYKTEFRPVYVRVDKRISKFGGVGIEYERMGEDCLWVNLIERAYAMSGLHETERNEINLPISPDEAKTKKWKPSVYGIEGGSGTAFLENMLGPDGVSTSIMMPGAGKIKDERMQVERCLKDQEAIKDMDPKNPESVARHAFYKFYKRYNERHNSKAMSEAEFQKLSEKQVIREIENLSEELNVKDFEHLEDAYKVIKETVQNVIDATEGMTRNTLNIQIKLGAALDKAVDKIAKESGYKDYKLENAESDFRKVYNNVREGIMEMGLAENIPERVETLKFYNTVKDILDKGLPISCGTYSEKNDMLADEQHAYSLIGVAESDGVPKRYFFRIKNPHTKLDSNNGSEYRNEDGEIVGKWVNVKDGIFDIDMETFCHDYENLHFNGGEVLTNLTHKKVVGYDIITPEQIAENEKNTVTNEKLVDYMKAANDLYEALVNTNSKHSNDSQQYKDLVEGIKQFRKELAGANGLSIDFIKEKLTQPLMKHVQAYEKHVNDQLLGPSKRQKRRVNVCAEIHEVISAIEEGHNPHQEYEKRYAKALMEKFYEMNGYQDKTKIDEVADRLYNNKAFRGIANNTNILSMKKPAKGQMEKDLTKIETSLKSRGIDKRIDMATMKATKDPLMAGADKKEDPKKGNDKKGQKEVKGPKK